MKMNPTYSDRHLCRRHGMCMAVFQNLWVRRVLAGFALVVSTACLPQGPDLSQPVVPSADREPFASFYGARARGPVDLAQSPNYTTILTKSVPPGRYAVRGRVVVSDTEGADNFPATVRCSLFSGGSLVDTYSLRMGGPGTGFDGEVFILQGIVHTMPSDTELSLRCRKGSNDTTRVRVAENPKLNAIQVGDQVLEAKNSGGPDDLAPSPSYTTVLSRSLPAGRYVAQAKVVVADAEGADDFPATARCTLFAGSSVIDTYALRMGVPGSGFGARTFALQGIVESESSTSLRLRCRKGSNDTTRVRVTENPRFTAIRVQANTFHTGQPSGPDDIAHSPNYTTVLSQSVPPGRYVVYGKVVGVDAEGADSSPATARCTLFSGDRVVDTYPLQMGGQGSGFGSKLFALQGVTVTEEDSTRLRLRCRKGSNDTTRVRVVENPKLTAIPIDTWTQLDGPASEAAPAISGHTDRRVHILAVGRDGVVRHRRTNTPGDFTPWVSLEAAAPPDGFHPQTAPQLVSSGNTLHAFARGADDNLYRTTGSGSSWSGWVPLTDDGSVRGRLSVAMTRATASAPEEVHVAFRGSDGVLYRRFQGQTLVGQQVWEDAHEGTVGSNGSNQIGVAVRLQDNVELEVAEGANWEFVSVGQLPWRAHDLSNIVFFDDEYHLLYSRRILLDDVIISHGYVLTHTAFGPGPGTFQQRRIHHYQPVGGRHVLSSLVRYRNKLLAAYRDPNRHIRYARWDNADPRGPWIGTRRLTEGRSDHRPVLAVHNGRTGTSGDAWGEPRFGNDAFAAITQRQTGSRIGFINFSRALMRFDATRSFALYNSNSDTLRPVCRHPDDDFGPTLIPDLWEEDRPFLTELGFNLWVFPHWLARDIYQNFARFMCDSGPWTGAHAGCQQRRLGVYVKASGGIFNCSGAWNNRNDSFITIWEELGHYFGPALGIGNALAPTPETANRTGLPLDVLEEAHALFQERTGTCGGVNGRCPGFTGHGGNYDSDGREHSFIYAVYYYLTRGEELRTFVQQDLAANEDLLQRKYNWIRDHLFQGIEFRGEDVEPL